MPQDWNSSLHAGLHKLYCHKPPISMAQNEVADDLLKICRPTSANMLSNILMTSFPVYHSLHFVSCLTK
jgi:hypothetical protein